MAVGFLIVGHSVRVRRWNNILPNNDDTLRSVQFASLSIGYVANFFIPLKLGELLRSVSYSFWGKKDFSTSLASVIFERLVDIIVWILVISAFMNVLITDHEGYLSPSFFTLSFAVLALAICYFLKKSQKLRMRLNKISSIFNDEISFNFRHFFWSLGESYERFKTNRKDFILNTFVMWFFYLASYYLLSMAIEAPVIMMISSLFNAPLSATVQLIIENTTLNDSLMISAFFLSPVLFIATYLLIKNKYSYQPKQVAKWFTSSTLSLPDKRDLFASKEQYQMFLLRSFRSDADIISEFYRDGMNDDTILHRIFHGGSDALTTMVSYDNNLYVRKFASKRGKAKLKAQQQWLIDHANSLPLATVAGYHDCDGVYTYDMPYSKSSIDFYEYIHAVDVETSWSYLEQVINRVSEFHAKTYNGDAPEEVIAQYLNEKLVKNFQDIKELAIPFFESENITINGNIIDLKKIEDWLLNDDFIKQFEHKNTATIHGDLTIENVIIDNETKLGWFIIDPNVGNLFESPLLDYAKLMQSLHLGYESLNRGIQCESEDGKISVSFYRSSQYSQLSNRYDEWLQSKFSPQYLKEVRLHEIIHYMRLVPYKFRKDQNIGLAFTACMLLLVDKFMKEYK